MLSSFIRKNVSRRRNLLGIARRSEDRSNDPNENSQ